MVNGSRFASNFTPVRFATRAPAAPNGGGTAVVQAMEPLLLDRKAAAAALAISPSLLANLTAPRGPILSIKIGTCVRYRPEDLRAYLAKLQSEDGQQTKRPGEDAGPGGEPRNRTANDQ